MANHSEYSYFLRELFPAAGADLLRLLQGAADNSNVLRSDFHTIRDWTEVAGYADRGEVHAMLLLMMIALEEGSLCIELSEPAMWSRLRDLVPDDEATAWARRIEQALAPPGLPELVGASPHEHKPVIAFQSGSKRFLYFQKYLHAENDFHAAWTQRLERAANCDDAAWPAIVRAVFADQPFRLDADQQLALGAALLNNLTIISGGPGTGKTSIVLALLRCLSRSGVAVDRIALAAPTGRAAQRLTDSLRAGLERLPGDADAALRNMSAGTLHQLLAYRPSRNVFARHRENPIPADVVIVDEVSMVGLVLMSQLLQALMPQTRLILLGDKNQLPSVDAGAILASLISDDHANGFRAEQVRRLQVIFPDLQIPAAGFPGPLQDRAVLLTTNHRSEEHIRATARAINEQDATVVERLQPVTLPGTELESLRGCRLLEQASATPNELRGFLDGWIEQTYFQSRLEGRTLAEHLNAVEIDGGEQASAGNCRALFTLLERFRLLTLVRDGAWGCDEINEYMASVLRPRLDGDANAALFPGAPVLVTRNDATRGLFNGDLGVTVRQRGGGLRVVFERQGGALSFPAESLPAHELGFALTVHKSQGSEYGNVLVVLPPTGGRRLLTKELIYTAITRAKSLAILCGTREALKFAIERKIVRESGVMARPPLDVTRSAG